MEKCKSSTVKIPQLMWKKIFVVFVGLLTLFNSVFDSTIPSRGIRFISKALNVQSKTQHVLPTSVYLIGYVMGPLAFGPMSELYGRRPVMVGTFVLFIIFRPLCSICVSSPIAVTGGLFTDFYRSPLARRRTMALSMVVTTAGPQFAPLIAGFIALLGGGGSPGFAAVTLIPPRKHGEGILVKTFTRPLYMIFYEPIISLTYLYLFFASVIFFIYFEAYPLVFQDVYRMSDVCIDIAIRIQRLELTRCQPNLFAVGACIGMAIFLAYDSFLQRAKSRKASWSKIEEYQRLPLSCLWGHSTCWPYSGWAGLHPWRYTGSSSRWQGYTLEWAFSSSSWLWSIHEYAASAMAAASCCRSVFGAVFPLAAAPSLINWA
ncbi:uncharacterized protein N7443_009356 [Penicillium atrosanguineum]|uniref:uncharacterized protein n=1 Tax=Penicillium atrosanguineum TaxID=1132637 RepID=UPI0023941172|nr:uncharacterized protein N7443_009356 [Penicillium atrosanguineum]KAJ5293403.1 hypothetical protein N7443_009356 [Penicillium atrosanguineum]